MKYVTELCFGDFDGDCRRLVGVFPSTKAGLEEAVRMLRSHVFCRDVWSFESIFIEFREVYDAGLPTASSPEIRYVAGRYWNPREWEGGFDELSESDKLKREEFEGENRARLFRFVEDALAKFLMDPTPAELAALGYAGENARLWRDEEVFEDDPGKIDDNKFDKFYEALTPEQNAAFEALMDSCDKIDGRFIPRDGGIAGFAFEQSLDQNQLTAWKYLSNR